VTSSDRTIFTVGHSTRTFDEFVEIVRSHRVKTIADVRLIPKSRRYPHFADTSLAIELPKCGIAYAPFRSLGGRRRPLKNSPNCAWRNESFRGYADYMMTDAFRTALDELIDVASKQPTAIMCAEAVPWRCHRSLIGDALIVRGWTVLDIMGIGVCKPHRLPDFARVVGDRLEYPAEPSGSELFP
jgi:uncharacterized protein (DUF488 family)